jgi:hypothetical protein
MGNLDGIVASVLAAFEDVGTYPVSARSEARRAKGTFILED